ncbi:3-methyl-2-oxobutanoate hydroxymethyltransferase [Helicobacter monodelphidis]|uniref:3-methyl-2-oxobutanoate hydroxymethyltransferase n=1 Tax=Helicobacter sp. 15-1451 TaxID=2004995 RepID=UPI000DCE3E8D|nr:3-methyl-2-oxobutanoate hydroxymethyltransferase [Helicobacter sp. 15-1451]RAX57936.1 3-methyl-2-oxobutanoate hydroxymethyltransferase [Helicobacter sp. 15-1451]
MQKISVSSIRKKKGKEKITMITAYDALMAKIFDGEVEVILVGDSLAMSFGGYKDTLSINMDNMLYHTMAVKRGVQHSLIVADMPFGSYNSPKQALKNATKLYQQGGADAIKLEGGLERLKHIQLLTQSGIAVMAHIGLKPQFVRAEGGYKIQGKDDVQISTLKQEVEAFNQVGVFAIVLEGVKSEVAAKLTKISDVPIIGIGSGKEVDGQVLVWSDAFGFFEEFQPRFVRRYLEGRKLLKQAIQEFAADIKNGYFPSDQESY